METKPTILHRLAPGLKQLFVSLALLLMTAPSAWAQYESLPQSPYNLWVKGTAVTDDNKANILNDDLATVSYDSESNVLTLNNATVSSNSIYEGCIVSGRASLTISVIGDNVISSNDSCTAIIGYGEGEKTLTIVKGADNCSLALNTSRAIRDFAELSVNGLFWNDTYTYTYDTTLEGYSPGYRLMGIDGEEASKVIDPETFQVTSAPTLTDLELYDLWIAYEQVTSRNADDVLGDGTVRFDATTNTLTLDNADIKPEGESPGITYGGEQALTIMLLGNSSVQANWGCEGIRIDSEEPTLIFTTSEETPGQLVCNAEGPIFYEEYINVVYENGLGLSTTAGGQMVARFTSYDLWVMGNRVTSVNKEDIMGDGTVRFNPATSTLALYGAVLGTAKTDSLITTSLPSLTVELHGNNVMRFSVVGFHTRIESFLPSLTFVTSKENPGQLSWLTDGGILFDAFEPTYSYPLVLQQSGNLVSASEAEEYGLMVGSTAVTSLNCTDILADGEGTVRYVPESQTLVLNNAWLSDMGIESSLFGTLNVYLMGDNYISGTDNIIASSVEGVGLNFTTSENQPGTLTIVKTADEGNWISGFATTGIPDGYTTATDGNTMTISRIASISPLVHETADGSQPIEERLTEDFYYYTWDKDPDEYVNVVVDDVLYTLRPGDYSEADATDPDDFSGVNLTQVPADMDGVLSCTPGSEAYADAFKGITIQVPAGTGNVIVKCQIGTNARMAVQIGDNAPVKFPNEDYPAVNEYETVLVPYSCEEPTFVYVYLADDNDAEEAGAPQASASAARALQPWRGRVITGHIKVGTVGVSAAAVVSTNAYSMQTNAIADRAVIYELPPQATADNGRGIVLSTVSVNGTQLSRAAAPRRTETQQRTITELGTSVFDSVDKSQILYIDLTATDIHSLTVNRSAGIFAGFGHNTLIHLPEANDDGGEHNVVVSGTCAHLSLSEAQDFRAHKDFNAAEAKLMRTFTPGETATVFLPFALSWDQANGMGLFHTFKEINGNEAVFNEAEGEGIKANTPYIFVPSAENISASDVSVKALDSFQATAGCMVGTYERMLWADDQSDIFRFTATETSDVATGEFVRVEAGQWLPPFRAFIQADGSTPSPLKLAVGNITTAISGTSAARQQDSRWYSVSGQTLEGKPTARGIYINGDKKILVK